MAADITREGDVAVLRITLGPAFEGAPGRAHGGAVAALMDEVMGFVLSIHATPAYTGRLTVTYRAPTPLGVEIEMRAKLHSRHGRKLRIEADAAPRPTLLAQGEGLFITVDPERFAAGQLRRCRGPCRSTSPGCRWWSPPGSRSTATAPSPPSTWRARRRGVSRLGARAPVPGPARVGRQHHVGRAARHRPRPAAGARPGAHRGHDHRRELARSGSISRAAAAIAAGELDATLIVGAEAQHSAKVQGGATSTAPPRRSRHRTDDTRRRPSRLCPRPGGRRRPPRGRCAELAVGLVAPVHVYALFESVIATRAGRSPARAARACWASSWRPFTDGGRHPPRRVVR